MRIATSPDGRTFTDTGEVFLRGAASPDLTLLGHGRLIALLDHAPSGEPDARTVMSVSQSEDKGRTWSAVRPIRFRGGTSRFAGARHGDLVRMPGGRLRLYFTADDEQDRTRRRRRTSSRLPSLYSAATRNGLTYRVDHRLRVPGDTTIDPHVLAIAGPRGVHVLLGGGEGDSSATRTLSHLVSRDGRRFIKLRPSSIPNVTFIGSIVTDRKGWRAYVSGERGILSLFSKRGDTWELEEGIRLVGGFDPAVVRLRDGSYLMLYCTAFDDAPRETTPLVADDWTSEEATELWAEDELVGEEVAALLTPEAEADRDSGSEITFAVGTPDEGDAGAVAVITTDGNDDPAPIVDRPWTEERPSDAWLDTWDPEATDGFAPIPDFQTKVDYFDWYNDYVLDSADDNAYDAYAEFMPGLRGSGEEPAPWPELNDMFNAESNDQPPAPWDTKDHPDWATSNDAVQPLLEKFREASKRTGYRVPLAIGGEFLDGMPESSRLLLGITLPHLSKHRKLTKALLADSWRTDEDGKVSVDRMMRAWRTALRSASQLDKGVTLIEDLVSMAERALVQKNARWALKHKVIPSERLEAALETLRTYDRRQSSLDRAVRGEHGFIMDIMQYIFSPPGPGGEPRINLERARGVIEDNSTDPDIMERIARLGPEDARATLEAADRFYREVGELMSVGYPEVRASDIETLTERYLRTSPLAEVLFPSLSRYYKLTAREEASRRATQLAYAVHIFHDRHQRWPESLAELPPNVDEQTRIDPFSGRHFGYRVTDDGPIIYSVSENGIDDGGIHSPLRDDKVDPETGSDDFVFWPPQP